MTEDPSDRLSGLLHAGDRAVWTTAALVLGIGGTASDEQRAAATAVLEANGLHQALGLTDDQAAGLAAQASAPVHQVAALLRGDGRMWASQSDEALIAQGRASAQGASVFARSVLPALSGLREAFDTGARMLDVGTGVAALAVAYAELFPHLTVVGIDVLPRVLELAAQTVAASPAGDRVNLRLQDVASLDDRETYALAWMPAPFLPGSVLEPGVERVVASLVPGGWLMLAHGKYGGSAADDALSRFKTVAYGGSALDGRQADELLTGAGLVEVRGLPTPTGAPAITVGRRPLGGGA